MAPAAPGRHPWPMPAPAADASDPSTPTSTGAPAGMIRFVPHHDDRAGRLVRACTAGSRNRGAGRGNRPGRDRRRRGGLAALQRRAGLGPGGRTPPCGLPKRAVPGRRDARRRPAWPAHCARRSADRRRPDLGGGVGRGSSTPAARSRGRRVAPPRPRPIAALDHRLPNRRRRR